MINFTIWFMDIKNWRLGENVSDRRVKTVLNDVLHYKPPDFIFASFSFPIYDIEMIILALPS